MTSESAIKAYYERADLLELIDAGLKEAGVDPLRPGPDDLSPFDEFHIGGKRATADFINRLGFHAGMTVLDIGSGLGGPARYVAHDIGANVIGIDLSPEYCVVATELSRRMGMGSRTQFRVGNAEALDFADASFNGAYTIHTGMNILDKMELYKAVHDLLKPGAVFGIYDVMAGPTGKAPAFPLPWAATAETSHLVTPPDMEMMLTFCGFEIVTKADQSAQALSAFEAASKIGDRPGLARVMGPEFMQSLQNLAVSVKNGALAPWIFVARRV